MRFTGCDTGRKGCVTNYSLNVAVLSAGRQNTMCWRSASYTAFDHKQWPSGWGGRRDWARRRAACWLGSAFSQQKSTPRSPIAPLNLHGSISTAWGSRVGTILKESLRKSARAPLPYVPPPSLLQRSRNVVKRSWQHTASKPAKQSCRSGPKTEGRVLVGWAASTGEVRYDDRRRGRNLQDGQDLRRREPPHKKTFAAP